MAALVYPETLYKTETPANLASRADRKRLSGPGLKAFFNLIDRTHIRDADARELLGGVSNGPYYAMKKNAHGRVLDVDTLQRISFLIGIYKALHILHSEPLADEWIKLPNDNPIFSGITPLDYMKRGGLPAMQIVRRLLDARRGGAR
ncbi:MAG TPA: antitoxin Xre/MbcA/ParS toxin-binding domain-containing protein [Candidatus Eremiobacteraceae bacterium]|nr:antitoxin Xre/MbcA/ParS toxin-binding domain-containing protein [Candidatus Eremiobacteraceae bacterium]